MSSRVHKIKCNIIIIPLNLPCVNYTLPCIPLNFSFNYAFPWHLLVIIALFLLATCNTIRTGLLSRFKFNDADLTGSRFSFAFSGALNISYLDKIGYLLHWTANCLENEILLHSPVEMGFKSVFFLLLNSTTSNIRIYVQGNQYKKTSVYQYINRH